MTRWSLVLAPVTVCITMMYADATEPEVAKSIRFDTVAIVIDTADQPLGAYQFTFEAAAGDVRIVGVENGDHPAFSDPPYYDPIAMQRDRVIVADFNTAAPEDLPRGKTRIATIHVQITGDLEPEYQTELTVAADHNGDAIPASIALQQGGQ